MDLYSFAISIHARPAAPQAVGTLTLRGLSLATLAVPSGEIGVGFERMFEEVGGELARMERLFFEPDGSFVWVSSSQDAPWQLDGVLYDYDERVLYVDLKGSCPPNAFDRLLATLGWPRSRVMFQLTREAVFLDEDEFRRYAAAGI